MFKNTTLKMFFAFFLLTLTNLASANLIVNGGFEETDVKTGKWKWFKASDVNGWNGSNIEIWDNLTSFKAFEGSQHAELNAHGGKGGAFSIFQSFNTQVGAEYEVSFAYAARRSNTEAFLFEVFSSELTKQIDQVMDSHTVNKWSTYKAAFTAVAETTTLRFTSIIPRNRTIGNFIDDIAVFQTSPTTADVPAPSALILALLSGLIVLVRRNRA